MEVSYKLEVMGCRIFQAVLKMGNYGMGYRMPQYLEGPGRIRQLGAFLREKGINDVLVVTGSGMVRRGQVQPMLEGFQKAGIRHHVITFDHPDPSSLDVEAGFDAYKTQGCKAIVALGGGSRIDCAKGIAAKVARPRKTVTQLQGLLKVHKPMVPLVAIPTTAGAGSETTVAAVITDSRTHRKAAINDPCLIPRYAVLDPELTMEIKGRNLVDGLPKNIVVHSEDVRGALLECLVKITTAIKETLERTPPELSADIIDRGITLTGGGALLRGLDQLIQSETGIDVHIAEDPLDCVAKGAGAVLDHVDVLHDVLDTDGGHM